MKRLDLTGKCGSCGYFHQIKETASGECRKFPYGDDVCHDPKHPYFITPRSRQKCKLYRAKPMTNYDRIVHMTPEELAIEETSKGGCPHDCETPDDMDTDCVRCWLDWLKHEVDNG